MSEHWRTEPEAVHTAVVILPDGSEHEVDGTAPFAETIRKYAREAGLSKFDVFIDGTETDAAEAPNDFSEIDEVEIKKYDEGA